LLEPHLAFPPSIADARNVIDGAPLTSGPDTPLWADFKAKVSKLDAAAATKAQLLADAEAALKGPVRRAYDKVIKALEAVSRQATSDDGVWRLPNGAAYYAHLVKISTGTELTRIQVHEIGLQEMARIHSEMVAIKAKVGYKGTLQDFFAFIKADPQFHYPDTDAGREQYLADARAAQTEVLAKASSMFHHLPSARLEVKAVEKWRQATAPIAFYNRGSPDGTPSGIFYLNLSDIKQTLKPQLRAIACHEGAPGHHFQSNIALEGVGHL